jgi:hypothetical protein
VSEFSIAGSGKTWNEHVVGSGALQPLNGGVRLINRGARSISYSNAQVDDYQGLSRRAFPWSAPLRLTLEARFSHGPSILSGTAGFGFWNDPFMMTGRRWPTLPRALWFFYSSPPSNMALARDVPGPGWKAATIDAMTWPFAFLLPAAPLGVLLMRKRSLYRRLWPLGQRAIRVCEATIRAPMTEWHTYGIDWRRERVQFVVDGETILNCASSPRGTLGLVIWIDNQYMIVTPRGDFGHGLLEFEHEQYLEVGRVSVER